MADNKIIYADKLRQVIVEDKQIRGPAFAAVMRHLSAAPAVEARPVVYGRWIKGKYPGEYTCSRCGMEYCEADPADKQFKYCPECGSKNE